MPCGNWTIWNMSGTISIWISNFKIFEGIKSISRTTRCHDHPKVNVENAYFINSLVTNFIALKEAKNVLDGFPQNVTHDTKLAEFLYKKCYEGLGRWYFLTLWNLWTNPLATKVPTVISYLCPQNKILLCISYYSG